MRRKRPLCSPGFYHIVGVFLLSCRRLTGRPGIHHLTYLQTTSISLGGNSLLLPNWKPHVPGDCCATPSAPTTFQRGPQWHRHRPLRPVAAQHTQIRPPAGQGVCAGGGGLFCGCRISQDNKEDGIGRTEDGFGYEQSRNRGRWEFLLELTG